MSNSVYHGKEKPINPINPIPCVRMSRGSKKRPILDKINNTHYYGVRSTEYDIPKSSAGHLKNDRSVTHVLVIINIRFSIISQPQFMSFFRRSEEAPKKEEGR